jgi:hypothetical protein
MGRFAELAEELENEVRSGLKKEKWEQFLVQLVAQEGAELGRDAAGGLPLRIVGHKGMGKTAFEKWAYEQMLPVYGEGFAKRTAPQGIDMKAMLPGQPIGRTYHRFETVEDAQAIESVKQLGAVLSMVERYPVLYNAVALEMKGLEPMTVQEFSEKLMTLPSPKEMQTRQFLTLGDLIAKNVTTLPAF